MSIEPIPLNRKKRNNTEQNLYIGFACFASAIAIGIVIFTIVIILGFQQHFERIIIAYTWVGIPIVCLLLWPFMKKNLK